MKVKKLFSEQVLASTLVEVLIFMILSGIVFLSIMNGLELQNRFLNNIAQRIVDRTDQYAGYFRIVDLVGDSDSMCVNEVGEIALFRQGYIYACVFHADSVLIVRKEKNMDTLLSGIVGVDVTPVALYPNKIDSLFVKVMKNRDSIVRFGFVPRHVSDSLFALLDKAEQRYRYKEEKSVESL